VSAIRIPFGYHATAPSVYAARPIKGDFMALVSRISVCIVIALTAISGLAQTTRHRAVSPANAPTGPTAQILFTVKDASNGLSVASATLAFGTQTQSTNVGGQATLALPIGKPAVVTITHPAFATLAQTFTAQPSATFNVTLIEKPSVTIKLKNEETHVVDIGTSQFANGGVFSSPARSDNVNFCKDDGTDFAPDKSEFTRILGPAVSASAPQCCQFGNVLSTNVEMKSGAKLKVYFRDTCSGNEA
jgi:hypothetical protein